MVPREAGRGSSFVGAGAYYLHDKQAATSERVAFAYTQNVPTNDPHKALKWMAWTAIHAEDLKRESGTKTTGRPCAKPVFTFSLSWHPEQEPKKWEMIGAGRRALIALGLAEHETVMISHQDTDHPHLHLIVNTVHPETGKVNSVSYSKLKLSKWAEEYEREHGKIYCDARVENNAKRDQGQKVNVHVELVSDLYHASDGGQAFQAALAEHGFRLAQGKGKRILLIDSEGVVFNLARRIEGVKSKEIWIKLQDVKLAPLEEFSDELEPKRKESALKHSEKNQGEPDEVKSEPDYFDRDHQDQEWQESIIDAAIEEGQKRKTAVTSPDAGPTKSRRERHRKATSKIAELIPDRPPRPPSPFEPNRLQDRHLAELGDFYTKNTHARLKLAATLDAQYGDQEHQLRQDIEHLEAKLKESSWARVMWLKFTHQIPKTAEMDLHSMRKTLGNIEWRRSEAEQGLEHETARQREFIEARQMRERQELHPDPESQPEERDSIPLGTEDLDEDFGPSFEL